MRDFDHWAFSLVVISKDEGTTLDSNLLWSALKFFGRLSKFIQDVA